MLQIKCRLTNLQELLSQNISKLFIMKNKTLFRSYAKTFLAIAAIVMLSSCNRGVGCPTNFSIDLYDIIHTVVQILPF